MFEGYEAGGWHHVAQHLRFIMARQTFSLHLLEESILHFLGLLNGIATLHECRILSGNGGAGRLSLCLLVSALRLILLSLLLPLLFLHLMFA